MKMIMRALCISGAIVLLGGCSQKEEFRNLLNRDSVYTNSIVYTKKMQLKDEHNLTVAVATATYLNPLYPERFNDGEYFFVGLFMQEGPNRLQEGGVELLLGNRSAVSMEEAQEELLKRLPLVNGWSSYYVIGFAPVESNTVKLRFGSESLGYESVDIRKSRQR